MQNSKPNLLVRYAADACDSGAAARHEKGGGSMTYIENIFLCMVSPLLVAALCMGRRQLRFFLLRYPARSSPPSRAGTPRTQSTARRCGSTAYSSPRLSAFSHRQAPVWRRRRARSSCRTRSGWREYPRRCSRTPAAAHRTQARATPCGSGSLAHLLPPEWPAKCAGR